MGVVIRDVLWAIWWVVIRVMPTYLYVLAIPRIIPDKFAVGIVMLTILYVAVNTLVLFLSNALPNLVFRYSAKIETRDVCIDGREYHQIKIFGYWFYFTPLGESCNLTFAATFTPLRHQHFMWSDNRIAEFLNAHRKQEIESSNHVTFVRGEKVR